MLAPEGGISWPPLCKRVDNAIVRAIARAFRWRKLLETGVYGTVDGIAAAESINDSYVSRILRLTLLAPDIVQAILDGHQPVSVDLHMPLKPFPADWKVQQQTLTKLTKV